MTEAPDKAAARQADAPDAPEAGDRAWYLYGIVRAPGSGRAQGRTGRRESGPFPAVEGVALRLVEQRDLAAVVRAVSRHEFTDEALQERLRDPAALEAMARDHNQVIAGIHGRQAILPAKLGAVYVDVEDVRSALEPAHDTLRDQLDRLEGCDEWAVHVYADRGSILQSVAAEHPAIRRLREDLRTARPGRAYFLERKLTTELETATDQTLDELAHAAYDRLAPLAVAGQVNPSTRPASSPEGEIELLRAAFLVPRADTESFMHGLDSLAADHEGVRCESSGPWPPYSFAAGEQP
ncbi:MAG: GvpL/GvpF family gas vesicle protein [Chloroflexi bacterium]|nr:GvpL/GvpF family gas vesicle protein [Chloroflexota bacterium]